jgi:hypothetical protein
LTGDIQVDEGKDSDDEPALGADVECQAPADVENGIPVLPTSLSAPNVTAPLATSDAAASGPSRASMDASI